MKYFTANYARTSFDGIAQNLLRIIIVTILGYQVSYAQSVNPQPNDGYTEAIEGLKYHYGWTVPVNKYHAFELFEKSAAYNHPIGMYHLGAYYVNGITVEPDSAKGQRLFMNSFEGMKKLALANDPAAQTDLGNMYYRGDGCDENLDSAKYWYEQAANQRYALAENALGVWWYFLEQSQVGANINKYDSAGAMFLRAEKQKLAAAQFYIGLMMYSAKSYKDALVWFRKAAAENDETAQHYLGVMYELGLGIKQDYKQAFVWYEKASDNWDIDAMAALGTSYQFGKGVQRNDKLAEQFLLKATNRKNFFAQYQLYRLYLDSNSTVFNLQKGLDLLYHAAQNGDDVSQNFLGATLLKGEIIDKNEEEAIRWYKLAAEQGNMYAQSNLSGYYYEKEDFEEAFKYALESAKQGYTEAETSVGDMYAKGEGIKPDTVQAMYWYQKAAEQGGDPYGQGKLGFIYYYGRTGIPVDYKKALFWFTKSASQNNVVGLRGLASAYEYGKGVKQDRKKALQLLVEEQKIEVSKKIINGTKLFIAILAQDLGNEYFQKKDYKAALGFFQKAAENGNKNGYHNLAHMYRNGFGVKKDIWQAIDFYERSSTCASNLELGAIYHSGRDFERNFTKAMEYFLKAANDGESEDAQHAQFNVGIMYLQGDGVSQNEDTAAFWLAKAARQGYQPARKVLRQLERSW